MGLAAVVACALLEGGNENDATLTALQAARTTKVNLECRIYVSCSGICVLYCRPEACNRDGMASGSDRWRLIGAMMDSLMMMMDRLFLATNYFWRCDARIMHACMHHMQIRGEVSYSRTKMRMGGCLLLFLLFCVSTTRLRGTLAFIQQQGPISSRHQPPTPVKDRSAHIQATNFTE